LPSTERLSPFFPVRLLFGLRIVFNRIVVRANEFPSVFHDPVSALTRLARLLIQIIALFPPRSRSNSRRS
jgi:hypothetical protein